MRFPERGTDRDLVARLVRFVDARRPGWSTRIRGGSEREIVALEGLVAPSFRFPEGFRQTLAAFGHEDDALLANVQGTHGRRRSIAALASCYQDDDDPPDPRCPPILGSELGIWLTLDTARGAVLFEGSDEVFSKSWEHLVFQEACRFVKHDRPSYWASAAPNDLARALHGQDTLVFLDSFAEEHGLESAWFGDAKHRYFERGDASLSVSLIHGIAFAGYGDPAMARELATRTAAVTH